MEGKIRKHFDGNAYFLTALGTVFSQEGAEYGEKLNEIIARNDIREICIVNDHDCTFHRNVVEDRQTFCTKAEDVLRKIYSANPRTFSRTECPGEKCTRLARLNIIREAIQLKETAYIGSRIESEGVELKGFIYDRAKDRFEEASTDY